MCSALRAARSAVWVGSFAWLAKIGTLGLFPHVNSFCCSDCDDNALLCVLRLFGGQASNYLKAFGVQNMGRQFGSSVWLGWQESVLSAYFRMSTRSVVQIVMIMLCFVCFVSSVVKLRIISKLSSFKTWVGSLGRQFRLAGRNCTCV